MIVYEAGRVRTNNFSEDMGMKIGQVWQESMAKIAGASPIYAIYHEYESDFSGDYTFSLAVEQVSEGPSVVLEDNYEVFPVEPGETPNNQENIAKVWQKIWRMEESGQLNRCYTADFEKYEQDGSMAIYIAVRKVK